MVLSDHISRKSRNVLSGHMLSELLSDHLAPWCSVSSSVDTPKISGWKSCSLNTPQKFSVKNRPFHFKGPKIFGQKSSIHFQRY